MPSALINGDGTMLRHYDIIDGIFLPSCTCTTSAIMIEWNAGWTSVLDIFQYNPSNEDKKNIKLHD
jgi:hypothetical protein